MKVVSNLLLIFFMLGHIFVFMPQIVLAINYEGITSFQLYQPKANLGDIQAQYNLALLYQHGLGIPQDSKQAAYWYTKAAEQGHVNAQYLLGELYLNGDGKEVPQNFKQAVYWYTKAAEKGLANAQYRLGYLYDHGDEVPQDFKQAFYWYTKAAEQGHYIAKVHRDEMLEMMSRSQIKEIQKLSKELYEKIDNKAK